MERSALLNPITFAAALVAAGLVLAPRASRPQGGSPGGKPDSERSACKLLSAEEIQRITGNPKYEENPLGDDPGEGLGGGSSCIYGGWKLMGGKGPPMVSVILIPAGKGERYFDSHRGVKLAAGCTREAISGVGKDAYFESCGNKSTPLLYVKGGTEDLVVGMELETKDPNPAAAKKTIVAVANAAAAKMK